MSPILLPEAYIQGPGTPVNLGTAKADFWFEDARGKRFKELKQIDVHGTQILQPKDQIHLSLSGISSNDIMRAIKETVFVQLEGHDPIKCLLQNNDELQSTWVPLEPIDVAHSSAPGVRLEFVLFAFPVFYGDQDVTVETANNDNMTTDWWRCGQFKIEHKQ
jgi:hypothetical protein